VEVRTPTSKYPDGFEMTNNQIRASKDSKSDYQIYRLCALVVKTKEYKIQIYDGTINDAKFLFETKSVVAYKSRIIAY
jgi:hypothetical protein